MYPVFSPGNLKSSKIKADLNSISIYKLSQNNLNYFCFNSKYETIGCILSS